MNKDNLPIIDLSIANGLRKLASNVAEGVVKARRTCLTCYHFSEPNEQCQFYIMRPPARVIAFGCESHDEVVPF